MPVILSFLMKTGFPINYSSEVHPGEEVQLFCILEDGVIIVDGMEAKSGRHVFTTRILPGKE